MAGQRVALVGIRHEAMIACPILTDLSTTTVYRGADILSASVDALRGSTDALGAAGIEVVPLVFARCLPGGSLARGLYDDLKAETLKLLTEQGPFDGVLCVNHGAAEVEGLERHGDTDYVLAVRAAVGPDVPIAVPFDMHGQVTPELLDALTVMSCLRTAPHRDEYETSRRAAEQLVRVLRGAPPPRKAAIDIPILVPGEKVMTAYSPARELFAMLADYDARPGIVEAHLFVGFGWNDRPWSGMRAVVLAEDDERLALDCAVGIAARVWEARERFDVYMETASVREGLERARADGRKAIYLSDSGDNVTAGAGGDLTHVLQEALDLGMTDTVVAGIYAPDVVAAATGAGVGATIAVEIGRHLSGAPRPRTIRAHVEALGERVDTAAYANLRGSEHPWARLRIDGVVATFHAARVGVTAPGHLEAVGIDPAAHAVYVVKVGYAHPKQEDMLTRHICLISEGVADLDFLRLPYARVRRPVFPLDPGMEWAPRDGVFPGNRHRLA